jgi:hypothetical protein
MLLASAGEDLDATLELLAGQLLGPGLLPSMISMAAAASSVIQAWRPRLR